MEKTPIPEQPDAPKTVEEILRTTVQRIHELDTQADTAIRFEGDTQIYKENMRQRAALIAGLAERLTGSNIRGPALPEQISGRIEAYSLLAQQALESNNLFGMSTVLIPWGMKAGEQNELETIVTELYGEEKKDE